MELLANNRCARAYFLLARSSSASRCLTTASFAAFSLSRCSSLLLAVSTAVFASRRFACASRSSALSTSMFICASGWPAATMSPSFTLTSARRSGIFVAMSISVASRRPLLAANPSGRFGGPKVQPPEVGKAGDHDQRRQQQPFSPRRGRSESRRSGLSGRRRCSPGRGIFLPDAGRHGRSHAALIAHSSPRLCGDAHGIDRSRPASPCPRDASTAWAHRTGGAGYFTASASIPATTASRTASSARSMAATA